MRTIFIILTLLTHFNALSQRDVTNVQGKYVNLIKEVKLQGTAFKDFREKMKGQYDLGYQEEQNIGGEVIPSGYWVYVKEELPQIAEETEKGIRVRIGINTLTQAAKTITSAPKLYVWKELNPNPPLVEQVKSSSFANFSNSAFRYEIWFPSNGYYDIAGIPEMRNPRISGTVKIETDAYLFQEVKMTFEYPELGTEVTIGIDGLGRNDIPMKFNLGAGARAVVTGFGLVEGHNIRPIPISSEPSYAGNDNTGILVIDHYDRNQKTISGYFEFTCKTPNYVHKVRGTFKNIVLRRVQW